MTLGWDIVKLIREGHNAEAIQTLAAQRRITIPEARDTIKAWRLEHMPETIDA